MSVRDSVAVQNREGNHPLRWIKTGMEVERFENNQYLIMYDGSGRVLLRTWGNIRKIEHCIRRTRKTRMTSMTRMTTMRRMRITTIRRK